MFSHPCLQTSSTNTLHTIWFCKSLSRKLPVVATFVFTLLSELLLPGMVYLQSRHINMTLPTCSLSIVNTEQNKNTGQQGEEVHRTSADSELGALRWQPSTVYRGPYPEVARDGRLGAGWGCHHCCKSAYIAKCSAFLAARIRGTCAICWHHYHGACATREYTL